MLTRIEPQPEWPVDATPCISWGEWYVEVKVPPVTDHWGMVADTEYIAIRAPDWPPNSRTEPVCVDGVWYWDTTYYRY